jgi:hypothetical protein
VTDTADRRRLDATGWRLVAAETAGFGLIVFAAAGSFDDPWRAVGAMGLGIIWVSQIIEHRTRPG